MIALISDVHSNLEAFERVLSEVRDFDLILHAGDLVSYGPNPKEVIGLSRERGIISVKGNHDHACVTGDVTKFNEFAVLAVHWTMRILDSREKRYLSGLPEVFEQTFEGRKIVMIHGSPRDHLSEYIYPDHPDSLFKDFLRSTGADVLVLGHTHIPFVKKFGRKLVVNPGSVGQPRDGNPKASFATLDPRKGEIEIRRIEYTIERTQEKIVKAGLPGFLAERLEEGL